MAKAERGAIRLRHYTRVSSMRKILEEGRIIARDQNKVFGELANRKPLNRTDARERYLLGRGKGMAFVEFDVFLDELREQVNDLKGFVEYFVYGDLDLSNRNPRGFLNR